MQQDVLLPHVEKGVIYLLGATTENPSFECNAALLSRSHVVVLQKLEKEEIIKLLNRGVQRLEQNLEMSIKVDKPALTHIAAVADGDARAALNSLESLVFMNLSSSSSFASPPYIHVTTDSCLKNLNRSSYLYDKDGDQHFNIISALHKSMRGGDDNASIYWVARMLEGGEKPEYIARRILRFASEDIGLADPHALTLGVACFQACHMLGMPECSTALAQAAVYMARAPKSIEVYAGYNQAVETVKKKPNAPVPLHICNAPTKLMEELGYHKGYKYTPELVAKGEDATQDYLPECLKGSVFLTPPPSSS
uniref:ATPase WRNIP1 n=1 Tax=Paramoeba aestuarina TaxID=180227 RepID=A0A7S4PK20_9EUKA